VNALEVFYVAGEHDYNIVVASRHQEASDDRWAADDSHFEGLQGFAALTLQGNPDQYRSPETEALQIEHRLVPANESADLKRSLPPRNRGAGKADAICQVRLTRATIGR
jgi:hypothetical protein